MTDPGKGGKGRKAPYQSTLVRVPLPLKPLVVALIYAWRNCLGSILDPKGENLVKQVEKAIASPCPDNIPVNELNLDVKPVNKLVSTPESMAALQRENAQLQEQLGAAE